MVALLWIQSRMIFYIAAAYGYDPRHPMRPAELLAIQGVYATPAEARTALDGMGKPMAQAMVEKALASRTTDRLHRRLLKYLAKRTVRRYAGRLHPADRRPDRRDPERRRDEAGRPRARCRTTRARRPARRRR